MLRPFTGDDARLRVVTFRRSQIPASGHLVAEEKYVDDRPTPNLASEIPCLDAEFGFAGNCSASEKAYFPVVSFPVTLLLVLTFLLNYVLVRKTTTLL